MEQKPEYNIDEAKRAIEAEREERAARCAEELRAVMARNRCKLEPIAIITSAGVRMELQIVAEV